MNEREVFVGEGGEVCASWGAQRHLCPVLCIPLVPSYSSEVSCRQCCYIVIFSIVMEVLLCMRHRLP